VQISRDIDLLRPSFGSEPVKRQLDYARELGRREPGAFVTIIVPVHGDHIPSWRHENLQVLPVKAAIRGGLGALFALHTLHRAAPISVITTQVPYDEGWVALAAGRLHGIPVIAQIHSDLFAEHSLAQTSGRVARAIRRYTARRALPRFDAVRTVSAESRATIAKFAAAVPLATIPVPVPMVSRPRRALSGAAKEPLVLFVGRLAPEKDLSAWLQVAEIVSRHRPEARFEIIGEGPDRQRLEREAEALGLQRVLTFRGFVPYAELHEAYAKASIFLLTSKSEGFGRVLVEAASQGTPAVSTSLAGPRDVIVNGVTGFLHEPGDIAGLARSVSTLLRHPDRVIEMGSKARALVSVKFNPETLRNAWVDLWISTARARRCAA
jgi:glycosyltransferase involved in cell wall biosynthesis